MNSPVIAAFLSAHGFGHAARGTAVMAAIHARRPDIRFDVYTSVPAGFFADALPGVITLHEEQTDVGMVQKSPLEEDPGRTLDALDAFYPVSDELLDRLAGQLRAAGTHLVLCDISPLGILAAQRAGIPSVLVENFTWDWIYAPYTKQWPGFRPHIDRLKSIVESADIRIQTHPVCCAAACDLTVGPICRDTRETPAEVRRRLDIPEGRKLVVIALGGTPIPPGQFSRIRLPDNVTAVIPGGNNPVDIEGIKWIPTHSSFHHPDLIRAADAVVGKAGYSTLAEIYHAGTPFGHVSRPRFREAPVMESFIREHMSGVSIPTDAFESGSWVDYLDALFALPRIEPTEANGADQVAEFLIKRI